MLGKLIHACIKNRFMVLLMTMLIVAGGLWSVFHITVDAIPDLSDVQVVIRTEYPGQAPQIVEDQVTYPLSTAMLAVPFAKVVRGYSMFGSSFVYIIFEDGTDLYWARSRVLEQLNFVSGSLPANIAPQLGPDATGVGWVYEYALITGRHCADPDHARNGIYHDTQTDRWHATLDEVPHPNSAVRHRVFPRERAVYADHQENKRYDHPADAPPEVRDRLERMVIEKGYDRCPLDGSDLVDPDLDLSDLRFSRLVSPIRIDGGERRQRSRAHRRLRQAISGGGRSGSTSGIRPAAAKGTSCHHAIQCGCGRSPD